MTWEWVTLLSVWSICITAIILMDQKYPREKK
jgi:hypothetical protein